MEDDDIEFELKSWHSADPGTFITEPKLNARAAVGKQALEQAQQSIQSKVTGYTPGNFIERNKALGPDARYYFALTKEESARIDQILSMENLFDEEEDVI